MKSKSLLATIRTELSLIPIGNDQKAYSELVGLTLANSFVELRKSIIASFENAPAARRLIKLLDILGIDHILSSYVPDRFGGVYGHKYEVKFYEKMLYQILIEHDLIYEVDILPISYLMGLFLARGNLYISRRGGYRLTFASRYRFALLYASDLLSEMHISFSMQKRKGKDIWFLHVTKFEEIVFLLRRFGLKQEVSALKDIYDTRNVKKEITRITNIEYANLKRTSEVSSRQVKKLSLLSVEDIPPRLFPLWKLRVSPEGKVLSYREIAGRLGWTKARVSRGLKKLEQLAEKKQRKKGDV